MPPFPSRKDEAIVLPPPLGSNREPCRRRLCSRVMSGGGSGRWPLASGTPPPAPPARASRTHRSPRSSCSAASAGKARRTRGSERRRRPQLRRMRAWWGARFTAAGAPDPGVTGRARFAAEEAAGSSWKDARGGGARAAWISLFPPAGGVDLAMTLSAQQE
jgi:hypothetical protein